MASLASDNLNWCRRDYTSCQRSLEDASYWDFSQQDDVVGYEALRIAVRHMAGLIESGSVVFDGFLYQSRLDPDAFNLDPVSVAYRGSNGQSTIVSAFNSHDPLGDFFGNWRTWTYFVAAGTCAFGTLTSCAIVAGLGFGARSAATAITHGVSEATLKTIGVDALMTGASITLVSAPASVGAGALVTQSGAVMAPALSAVAVYTVGATLAVGDVVCALRCTTWIG